MHSSNPTCVLYTLHTTYSHSVLWNPLVVYVNYHPTTESRHAEDTDKLGASRVTSDYKLRTNLHSVRWVESSAIRQR